MSRPEADWLPHGLASPARFRAHTAAASTTDPDAFASLLLDIIPKEKGGEKWQFVQFTAGLFLFKIPGGAAILGASEEKGYE